MVRVKQGAGPRDAMEAIRRINEVATAIREAAVPDPPAPDPAPAPAPAPRSHKPKDNKKGYKTFPRRAKK